MQYRAGYILESVWKKLRELSEDEVYTLKIEGLLENITTFDVITTVDLEKPEEINSLLAVANNIITRGTPTLCSVLIEEELARAFNRTEKRVEYGTIKYPFINDLYSGEKIFKSLHYIYPETSAVQEQLYLGDLDSDFEKHFINSLIPDNRAYLRQLFQHQRKRNTINETIRRGRVDFSLSIPYINLGAERLNRYKDSVNLKGKKQFIVEVDGAAYHTEEIDDLRDAQINDMLNTVSRITETNLGRDVRNLFTQLGQEEFINIIAENYSNPADPVINSLIFTPIGVARIQKVLIEYLISHYEKLNKKTNPIKIAIIEQDVPCAWLAINDLSQLLEKLAELENKDAWVPKFELVVVGNELFQNSLLITNNTLDSFQENDYNKYDLVIDVSVLRREGVFQSDIKYAPNVITIRSSHFTKKDSYNQVFSANLLTYREIARAINNEEHEIDEEAEKILEYFLQNIFRKEKFFEGQLPILNRALTLKPVIGLLPTGGGKSLTYQLSSLLQPGLTIVVDPIRSLMQDQYDKLIEMGIDKCDFINSTLSTAERQFIQTHELPFGLKQFLFVSPERFVIDEFRQAINSAIVNGNYFAFCVIDEVHCVSEWGHDFRTPYLNLGINAQEICKTKSGENVVLFGLTATASFDVLTDIERELQIARSDGHAIVRYENTLRDELNYQVIETDITGFDDGSKISVKDWKKKVGPSKQGRIKVSIEKKEDKIAKFNDQDVLRKSLEITYNQYLPRYQKQKYLDAFSGQNQSESLARDLFISESLGKLYIDKDEVFQKDGNSYNYGIIVFCPHKDGALGVHDIASSFFTDLPIEKTGTFVGSSNDEEFFVKKQAGILTEDDNSFKNLRLFIRNQQSIMVATKAFGMGIDKPDIRLVFHISPPSSVESFVQEAGRAGRDRKVSVSTIYYNRQLFEKKKDILTYFGKEIPANDPKKRWEFYNLDRDVLVYFFNNSFKGIDKEVVMINELLDEIYAPIVTNLKFLENHFNENGFAERDVILDLPKEPREGANDYTDYLFIKLNDADRTNIGRVTLLKKRTKNNSDIENYIVQQLLENNLETKDECRKWLNELKKESKASQGIETKLMPLDVGGRIELIIPFENKYYSKPDRTAKPPVVTYNTVSEDYVNLLLENAIIAKYYGIGEAQKRLFTGKVINAINENFSLQEFIGSLDSLKDNEKEKEILNQDARFKKSYLSPRSKSDTAKAIYRLNSLRIIDTYTINYQNKFYSVKAKKKSYEDHVEILEEIFTRYTSQQRAKILIQNINSNQNGRSIYKTHTQALTDFVYDLVAKKRLQAINDIIDLCEISVKSIETTDGEIIDLQRNPIIQNHFIKEEIYYYFNAKYSRKDNEALVKGVAVPASMPDDFNKLDFEEITWKFIDLTDTDETGEFRTNVKHLRGSAQKMLRAYPDASEFMVLKSFSLFILSETTPGLLNDARDEILKGLDLKYLEGDDLISFLEMFFDRIRKYYVSDEVEKVFEEILSMAILKNQIKKLRVFNDKFLLNYDNH